MHPDAAVAVPVRPRKWLAWASVASGLPAALLLVVAAVVAALGAERTLPGRVYVADANAIAALILVGLASFALLVGFASGGAGVFLAIRHPGRYAGKGTAALGLALNVAVLLLGLLGLGVAGFFTL